MPASPASSRLTGLALPLLLSALLAACGGGGGGGNGGDGGSTSQPALTVVPDEPNAPQATGNTATDGFNWFSFRRQQVGVQALTRVGTIDTAAQRHSDYQRINNVVSHQETPGLPGFSGIEPGDRLVAAGYQFGSTYAYGEVISNTSDPSGFNAAEDLIGAIYHRFVIFEPTFREAGTGATTSPDNGTYFTAKFTANNSLTGLAPGTVVVYPVANQEQVATNFFSDNEQPDPAPDRNEIGYPISVHANITANLTVQSFSIRPRTNNGPAAALATRLLTRTTDSNTPDSAAALIPLAPLDPKTTYDVAFEGTVNGVAVQRSWSFTTR